MEKTNGNNIERESKVYIVTGGIDTGKTTKLLSLYKSIGKGDGFINKKIFKDGSFIGQKIIRLSNGESQCFSIKGNYRDADMPYVYKYDVYCFTAPGLIFAYETISDILIKNKEPIFIDEIGPLELEKKGFYYILTLLLSLNKNIYMTVRDSCIENVVGKFNISDYIIIKV